jgi:antitoxin component HigA of HigAB toxin-antitoxin module
MEKIFENVLEITTRDDYEKLMSHVEKLIVEATKTGSLDDPEADNEYTREIGRLSCLGADYENEYIQFEHIKIKKKSPLIRKIENEMYSRNLKEKELADMIEIKESALRQIMRGRKTISIRTAKRLHQRLNIDAKLILDYA